MSVLAIITTFPFYLLTPLEAKGPIFNFFLRNFLKAFPALYFYRELAAKTSFKDINLSDLKSSLLTSGTLPPNINKLYNIFAFKPLISLKSNSRGTEITNFSTDSSSSVLTVKASTKS